MKTNQNTQAEMPEDLREYLNGVPEVSAEERATLRAAAQALEGDPLFQAEVQKGLFIESMLAALEERGETQSQLAKRWGKTRQYVSKLFNEDERVNFTVETLCEVAALLDQRVEIKVTPKKKVAPSRSTENLRTKQNREAGIIHYV